jgi:acyl transferase domain-containing protein
MASQSDDIAIIGMACVLPGAKDRDTFWENILAKRSFVEDGPDEWAQGSFDGVAAVPERIYTRKVALLGSLAEFDPVEFGVVPNAIPSTEPDHFLALKLAAAALKDSGYGDKAFDRSTAGVILGRGATPNRASANGFQTGLAVDQTMELLKKLLPEMEPETRDRVRQGLKDSLPDLVPEAAPGLVANVAVGRIANRLDLQGPSYLIDAACSSTLIAAELAMKELRSGQSRMMLAGGVQASMPPQVYMLFCKLNALSRDAIRPFDKRANGTVLSEGAGFVVLKRLADAQADGDKIYAVLKAAGIASDGRAQGLLTPRLEGEMLAVQRAYGPAKIDPATVGLVEAHGTGIPIGDQTEVAALRGTFGGDGAVVPTHALGSVKSMIGHCIPAAGIASIIKTALALHYKILPPTLCEEVNPALGLEGSSFYVNTEARPWIHPSTAEPRRAGINAFGFGGINAHLVLEEYREDVARQDSGYIWPTELFVLSAESPEALAARADALREELSARPSASLPGLSLTLAGEPSQGCRLAIVATSSADLIAKLENAAGKIRDGKRKRLQNRSGIYFDLNASGPDGKVAFLFPGQGSQYQNMLADLCMAFPEFRHEFDMSDAAFTGFWDVLPSQYAWPPPTCLRPETAKLLADKFLSIDVATETMFTAGLAMYRLLTAFGLRCDLMTGHSTGEYTSLAASGCVDVDSDDERIALKRKLNAIYHEVNTAENMPRGSLLTVGAVEPETLEKELANFGDRIHVAMDNCPHQKVLFGQPDDIAALNERLRALGGLCQQLPFNYAYHTALLEPMRETLLRYYEELPITAPEHPLFSCASLGMFPSEPGAIRELAASQWFSSVRFREAILHLHEKENVRTFVEVGPSNHLTSFIEDTLRKKDFFAVASNERTRPGLEQLQRMLGQLWCRGFSVDFTPFFRHRAIRPFAEPPPKKVSRTNRVLETYMPVMSLDDSLVQEVRAQVGLGGATNGAPRPAPASATAPSPVAAAVPSTQLAAPAVSAPALGGWTATDAAMIAHEQLMQEFLASQRRSIEALLEQTGAPLEP